MISVVLFNFLRGDRLASDKEEGGVDSLKRLPTRELGWKNIFVTSSQINVTVEHLVKTLPECWFNVPYLIASVHVIL